MISKESEYLIHVAEEQLERLNKSLYFYQKNYELENDLLSSSVSINNSNKIRCKSTTNINHNTDGLEFENELKPIYRIISKQRNETFSGLSNSRKPNIPEKRKHLEKVSDLYTNTDHIRDWRNGVSLVKETMGSNHRSYLKPFTSKSLSVSPCNVKKRERISTFWNDKSNKGNLKSPNKVSESANCYENKTDPYYSKRRVDDKEEIQRYIRYKQKLAKDKRSEANMTIKSRNENIKTSLNNLYNYHNDKFNQYKSTKHHNIRSPKEVYHMKSSSMSSLSKPKLPTPICDELKKNGLFEYIDVENCDHQFLSTLSGKYKNGLNSTVDSGIETGEWHRSLTPDKFRNSYDRINEHNWSLPPPLPQLSKSASQLDLKLLKKDKDNKFKGDYHSKIKKVYQEQISAYDASSETEMALESDDGNFKKISPSATSSTASADVLINSLQQYLSDLKSEMNINQEMSQSDSKNLVSLSKNLIPIENKASDPDIEFRSFQDSTKNGNSGECSIKDLKEALYNAQVQLNLDNRESDETLSEKISQAVQNFIKTKESLSGSSKTVSTKSPQSQYSSIQNKSQLSNTEKKSRLVSKSEKIQSKKDSHKEPSPEFVGTEIKYEITKNGKNFPDTELIEYVKENVKIPEKNSGDIENLFTDFNIDEKLPSINAYREELQARQERATQLIQLTKDLQKESKKVIRLEKKAFEISKKFVPSSKPNKKQSHEAKKELTDEREISLEDSLNISATKDIQKINYTVHQKTLKLQNKSVYSSEESRDNSQKGRSSQNKLSVSESDDMTISSSEITTTLTDQSELEARLLALQSEMEKKKILVSKLKKHQKDLKRDKIKQKELVLQKQIDMYDNHIGKLQISIDQLNISRIDDPVSEDSHTLTGSHTNLNELDSKMDQIHQSIHYDTHLLDDFPHGDQDHDSVDLISFHRNLLKEYDESHKETINLDSLSRRNSLDTLIDNNKHVKIDDIKFDSLLTPQNNFESVKDIETILSNLPKIDNINKFSFPKTKEKEITNDLIETKDPIVNINPIDIDITIEAQGDSNAIFLLFDENEPLDQLIKANTANDDYESESIFQQLYVKEMNNIDDKNPSTILDDLLMNNKSFSLIEFQNPTIGDLPMLEIIEPKFSDSKDKFDKNQKLENRDNEENTNCEIKVQEKKNDICDPMESKNVEEELMTQSDFSSHSSSIASLNVDLVKYNDQSIEIVIPKADDYENSISNKIESSETLSNDGSSISDIDSLVNCIDEDSIQNSNILKIIPKTVESDLKTPENIIETASIPKSLAAENCKYSDNVRKDNQTDFISEFLTSVNVEKIVDILLNTIIQSEIENFKPVFAKLEKNFRKTLAPMIISDYQSTSSNDEVVDNLLDVNVEDINPNVSKSEVVWELSDLYLEDPWKMEYSFPLITNDIEDIHKEPQINSLDKELIRKKVLWLIPLSSEFIDPLTDSAISYFYECRNNHVDFATYSFVNPQIKLPQSYCNTEPVVSEEEICTALFGASTPQPFVNKRLIFQIVLEIFQEIYSFEKHLTQSPWIHSSFMMKNNIYSLWKGNKPPESFDLVKSIVNEHIRALKSQNLLKDNENQSKIINWCVRQQKDDVDKLLITDMRKEENEWVYYDEAEEEVKFVIADDILSLLLLDTIKWVNTIVCNPK